MKTTVDQDSMRDAYFNQAQYHIDRAKELQTEMSYHLNCAKECAEKAGMRLEEAMC